MQLTGSCYHNVIFVLIKMRRLDSTCCFEIHQLLWEVIFNWEPFTLIQEIKIFLSRRIHKEIVIEAPRNETDFPGVESPAKY